jgi:adenine/guanine phosphoribosyltransferase-like PRPP-binding protein
MSTPAEVLDKSLRDAEVLQRNGYPYVIHPLMDGVPRVDPRLLQAWMD